MAVQFAWLAALGIEGWLAAIVIILFVLFTNPKALKYIIIGGLIIWALFNFGDLITNPAFIIFAVLIGAILFLNKKK